jgi:hypothetical protein
VLDDEELELDGAVVEPLALEPPDAESFFVASADEEALEDGELGVVVPDAELEELESFFDMSTDAEPEAEPEGELGVVVVEPAEEDDEPAGGVVRETVRSPSLSQPVSNPAPSARDTATARVESLMLWASVGWGKRNGARFRPVAVNS